MLSALLIVAQIGAVQFFVSPVPDTVVVRQQVSYDASLRLNRRVRPRFLEPPTYMPPEISGATVYDVPFDAGRSITPVTVDGAPFTQYTYHRVIFPLTPGVDSIPPSMLTYTLINAADPYASRRTTVQSGSQRFVVVPLPAAGRPADFSGAVGRFTLAMSATGSELRAGTSFVVRATLRGSGDVALLQRPVLTIPWADVVSTSDSVTWDFSRPLLRGVKEFRWLVTPQSGGRHTIPPLHYSYFDPRTHVYATIATPALPVTIAEPHLAARVTPARATRAAIVFPLRRHPMPWSLVLLLGGLMVGSVIVLAVRVQR